MFIESGQVEGGISCCLTWRLHPHHNTSIAENHDKIESGNTNTLKKDP